MLSPPNPPKSVGPRYVQIAQALRQEIAAGRYGVGSALPNEIALTRRFKVSRHTMREALRLLAEDGLVERRQGAGTTVLAQQGERRFSQALGSVADIMQYAHDTLLRVETIERIRANRALAAALRCHRGREWILIEGLRFPLRKSKPICLTRVYLAPVYASILPDLGTAVSAITELIEKKAGVSIARVTQTISAESLSAEDAQRLAAREGIPALRTLRRYLTREGQIVHASDSLHPGDRFRLTMSFAHA